MSEPRDLPAVEELTVLGYDWCEDTTASREWLTARGVPFRYVDMDRDEGLRAVVRAAGYTATPTIVTPAGAVVVEPSEAELEALIATLG
jgi:glutaredoxin